MKHLTGLLYLFTALVAFYWSVHLAMLGLYGAPFSLWHVVIFAGALVLMGAAVLSWTATRRWTLWVPVIGSVMLAAYFVPALIKNLVEFVSIFSRPTADRLIAAVSVGLVLGSLVVSVRRWLAGPEARISP